MNQSSANAVNGSLLFELYDYMSKNGSSESHMNNTLKTNSLFAQFLGPDLSFYDVTNKNQITPFLDTKMNAAEADPARTVIGTIRINKTVVSLFILGRGTDNTLNSCLVLSTTLFA